MCVKSYMVSSFVSQTTTSLNPCAQEWRPSSSVHNRTPPLLPHQFLQHAVTFTPQYQPSAVGTLPPPAAVQVVTAVTAAAPPGKMIACEAPQLSYCLHSLPLNMTSSYHQGFNPFVIAVSQPEPACNYHTTCTSFPANGYFHEAAPTTQIPGIVGGGLEMESPTANSPKCRPVSYGRKRFSPSPTRAMRSFSFDRKPARRQEWRPRKAYSRRRIPAGGAAVRSPVSVGTPNEEIFSPSSATTVMIKNIPNQLRRDYMLEFLDMYCYEYSLEYDFLYLPMDFRKKDNLGYAFVNFTSPADAEKFKKLLQNYEWGTVNTGRRLFKSNKICEITWARIQGKQGQLDRFLNSRFECDKLDFLPVVLDPPRNGSDPKPAPPVVIGRLQKRAIGEKYY